VQKRAPERALLHPRWFKRNQPKSFGMNGGDDETRTRDLCRDRREVNRWRTQNQQVTCAVVGNRWGYWAASGEFCSTVCSTLLGPGERDTAASMQLSVEPSPLPGCLYCPRQMSEFSTIPSDAGPAWFFGQTLERRDSNHSVPALYLNIVRRKSDP
jgi:hypothetical protein